MRKNYSDPLMFSNILLTGIGTEILESQDGGFGPKTTTPADSNGVNNTDKASLTTTLDAVPTNDLQIQPAGTDQIVDVPVDEETVQGVLEQTFPDEGLENPAPETSGIDE